MLASLVVVTTVIYTSIIMFCK